MKKDEFIQSIRNYPPKDVFVNLLQKYFSKNASFMKLCVCVIFKLLRTFPKIFVMFGNEDVCKIVLNE